MAINNIPRSFQFWNNISATPNDFNLDAGLYGLALHMAVPGTGVQLQKLLPDGVTYVAVSGAAITTDGYLTLNLPAGQYRLSFGTTTGLTGEIALIVRTGYR